MKKTDQLAIDRWESLARESIRCAIGEINGTTSTKRAREALREFQAAMHPATFLELVAEWKTRVEQPE